MDRLIEDYIAEADVVVPLPNPKFDPAKFDPATIGVQKGGVKMPKSKKPSVSTPKEKVRPPARVDTAQMQGWIARGCDASVRGNSLHVAAAGKGAFLANAKVRVNGPVEVKLRVRIRKNGTGRLQWRTEGQASFPKTGQTKAFNVPGGNWQELSVPLNVDGRLIHLRLFPPVQKQPVEIDWIEVAPAGGSVEKGQRWDFKDAAEQFQPMAIRRQAGAKRRNNNENTDKTPIR